MIPIEPRVRRQWRIEAAAAGAVISLVAIGLVLAAPFEWSWRIVILLGVVGLIWILPQGLISLRYRYWRYGLADHALILEHGVWTRHRSMTPYFRVQNVDISQGPLERWLGLKRLTIRTASAFTDATVPGLDAVEAEQLRLLILERTGRDAAV